MLVLVLLVVGTRRPSDGDSTAATDEDEYVKAASAGWARALRCLIVPALSLANGIESDSVLDVDCFHHETTSCMNSIFKIQDYNSNLTLKLASDPFRRWRNSMAGLPGSVSEVSILSLGLHSLVETIFMEDMVLLKPFMQKKRTLHFPFDYHI